MQMLVDLGSVPGFLNINIHVYTWPDWLDLCILCIRMLYNGGSLGTQVKYFMKLLLLITHGLQLLCGLLQVINIDLRLMIQGHQLF